MGKVYRIAVQPGDAYLVPGDMHYPFHHKQAVKAMWEWVHDRRAAGIWNRLGVVLTGDTIDPFGLSRFKKPAKKFMDKGRIMGAVDDARPFLTWAAKTELGCNMILANHEKWIYDALDDLPALEGCPGLQFGALTGLDDIEGLEILDVGTRVLLGDKVVITHGHGLPRTAAGTLRKYPDQMTVRGHDHHVYKLYTTVRAPDGAPQVRGVTGVGFLGGPDSYEDYCEDPDMQLGFAVIEFFGRRENGQPFFRIDDHVIVEDGDRCIVC